MRRLLGIVLIWFFIGTAGERGLWGQSPDQGSTLRPLPPEEIRLGHTAFREGLKQRGLTELLELHLVDFPPTTESESLLLMRDMALTRHSDPTRSLSDRRAALAEANDFLQQLIDARPDDPRRLAWRLELAESLILHEAEPVASAILFHGGSAAEFVRLERVIRSALNTLHTLQEQIHLEFERVEKMSVRQLGEEDVEALLDSLAEMSPRAEYLLLWAKFYDSLTRDPADPLRASHLAEIADTLAARPDWLETPHEVSGVRIPLLLLAGMTARRLHRFERATEFLDEARRTAEALSDGGEKDRLQPAVRLAALERVRASADAGAYHDALRHLSEFRDRCAGDSDEAFSYRLAAALLERDIQRRRATEARRQNRADSAELFSRQAWEALQRLVDDDPARRDRAYAAVFRSLSRDADPVQLDPFERCALTVGLLAEADESADPEEASRLWKSADDTARRSLGQVGDHPDSIRAFLLFHQAVAKYRLDNRHQAANLFLQAGRDFPGGVDALKALTLAVQIAAPSSDAVPQNDRGMWDPLYGDALAKLMEFFPDTDAGREWRFPYAQWLEQRGERGAAAEQFSAVSEDHPYALEAAYFCARCLARQVQSLVDEDASDPMLHDAVGAFVEADQRFRHRASAAKSGGETEVPSLRVEEWKVRAELLRADVFSLFRVNRVDDAIAALAAVEAKLPEAAELRALFWYLRLRTDIARRDFDAARAAFSAYGESSPPDAGPRLQALYDDVTGGFVERLVSDTDLSPPEAALAVELADGISAWASALPSVDSDARRFVAVQRAESLLLAERLTDARMSYVQLLIDARESSNREVADDVKVRIGYAEALFRLKEYDAAIRRFNPLALKLSPDAPLRWHALLRDLECRTALHHAPRDILKVIDQQTQLFPDMGGPVFGKRFATLRRENEQRIPK